MFHKISGAAAISTILIIGVIVFEIAIASLVTSYFASQGELGTIVVYKASFAAQSGIEDAFLKIVRNSGFNPSPNNYDINIGGATAHITVCVGWTTLTTACDTQAKTGIYEVTSLGSSLTKEVKVRALLYADPTTGLVNVQYIKEIGT
jgi:hypothetical protein